MENKEESSMKRKTLKFFACAAIMAMTLSVTACGGSDKEDKATETEAEGDAADATDAADDSADAADATDAADDSTDAADDSAGAADDSTDAADDSADAADDATDDSAAADSSAAAGTTLEELFKEPTAKAAFDSMTESIASEGMSASINAVGNEMIMEVNIEDSSLIVDGLSDSLNAALDAQAETFKTQVKTLDTSVGQEGACTFTVRYLDPDGNVLAERSFKAE